MSGAEPTRPASGAGPGIHRRRLLEGIAALASAALSLSVLYPFLRYLRPAAAPAPHPLPPGAEGVWAATVSELDASGWKILPLGAEPALLVKTAPGEYRAFSAVCTHLQCTVQFDRSSRRIWCACHNGWYDLEGKNVAGPPPRPLTRLQVRVIEDDIYVK